MRFALLVITFSLTVLCGSLMATEYRSAIFYRSPVQAQIEVLTKGGPSMGAVSSWRAQKEALSACLAVHSSVSFRLLPETSMQRVQESCSTLAEAILTRAPTTGLAQLVLMQGAVDPDVRSRQLALAQAIAPREAMQVKLRIEAGLDHFDTLSSDARLATQADMALLLSTTWGRSWLSAVYLDRADTRSGIAEVLATVPEPDQRAFLALLKRSAVALPSHPAVER